MTISIAGKLIHRAELWAAYQGRWTLEIAYSDTVMPSGKVIVEWGETRFIGTVDPTQGGAFNGEVVAKIVGGFGWSTELPAAWYQSDNPGVNGRLVATKAAEAVGETLYGATGTSVPQTSLFRPLRVSYSRAKQNASLVLSDVLAPGVSWWVDFDGATRVGVRVAPSPAARVVPLDYEVATGWVDLEAESPAGLIGATIPADSMRGLPALTINELFAWSGSEGFRFRASVTPQAEPGASRLAEALRVAIRGALPELQALALRRARVTAQAIDGRVSVQQVDRDGKVSDFGREEGAVRLYAGLPGVSADLDTAQTPETILAFARADWSDALAFLAPPLGQPGHVPLKVRLEASDEIRFVGTSAGVGRFGTTTEALAKADPTERFFYAVKAFAIAAKASGTDPTLAAAATALEAALSPPFIFDFPTTKLEAQ